MSETAPLLRANMPQLQQHTRSSLYCLSCSWLSIVFPLPLSSDLYSLCLQASEAVAPVRQLLQDATVNRQVAAKVVYQYHLSPNLVLNVFRTRFSAHSLHCTMPLTNFDPTLSPSPAIVQTLSQLGSEGRRCLISVVKVPFSHLFTLLSYSVSIPSIACASENLDSLHCGRHSQHPHTHTSTHSPARAH